MEGGIFQRLCDDWLYRKGYENINPIGMMATTDRVVKGTPDCLFIQPNGKYVFAEYTVQQDRLAKKLEDDICKCFDEIKTGISNEQIGEIIICHLGKLSTHEINKLRGVCHDRGVLLSLNGLDTLALSIQNSYPVLSEAYLDLPLDTGQLLSVDDFIIRYGKNNLTTSIDNNILFQENALKSAISVLDTANFLLVSGAAGVGKTLFSVNLAKEIQLQSKELNVICLFDKGADLIRDITAYFSEPGDYLIFVDDANRLDNRLDYLLHYLHENEGSKKFRIIATVRDYARESVIEKVKQYTEIHEQSIKPLSNDQIKCLTASLFGIKNVEYQKRIQEIACGNARLAVMASKVAVETNQIDSIQNITSLYDDYFGKNDSVKAVVEDEKLMAAACAISFFRKIDKFNETQMKCVQHSFGIQAEEFWELVGVLHKNELVDLYEGEVVKMSDQILSTYLFYITVFEKKIIPFSVIVNDFYPDFTQTIVDSLNPVISSFDHKKIISVIRGEVKAIFDALSEDGDVDKSIEFLSTFWFALPTEALVFSNKVISKISGLETDWRHESFEASKDNPVKSSLVRLLGNFRYYGETEFKMSFDLLLKYIEKDKGSLGFVVRNLMERYNFKPDDWRYAYFIQTHIVERLIESMDAGRNYLFTRLFILVANAFLKIEHRENQWSRGDTISIITFRLSPDSYILPLREKLIKNLSSLVAMDDYKVYLLELFKKYVNRVMHEGKEIVKADLPFFRDYFVVNLDQGDAAHCLIMQNYCENLESLELNFPIEWKIEFLNDTLELSNLLLEDRRGRRMLEMGFEEYNQYRHQSLVEYFSGTTYDQFGDFVKNCIVLNQALSGRDRDYSLKNGIEMSFRALAEAEASDFPGYVSFYLEYDDIFEINPHSIINNLFDFLPSEDVWSIISTADYRRKQLWRSSYFSLLPEMAVTQDKVSSLIEHVKNTPSDELSGWLEFLNKYQKVDEHIYPKIVNILVDKSKVDKNYSRPIGHLFNENSELFGSWFNVFKSDEELVYSAYLAAFKVDWHWDYSGKALRLLTERNFEFLFRVIDQIYESERWPDLHTNMPELNYLWGRGSYIQDVESYGKYLMKKDEGSFSFRENIFSKLFIKENGNPDPEELADRKQNFFRDTIKNNAADINYMCFIFQAAQYMNEDFRRELLALFIAYNTNFNDFQTLDYELTTNSWSGSRVPILEREKNFLASLLPIFNSIEFLEHKAYVEKTIEGRIKSIEYEKKRDFLESR